MKNDESSGDSYIRRVFSKNLIRKIYIYIYIYIYIQ